MDTLKIKGVDNLFIIENLRQAAIKYNINIYLVGGGVRDSLLGIEPKDLDFTLDEDPNLILPFLPFDLINYNSEFNTAKLAYKDISIDLVLCRREFYKKPGDLPTIEKGYLYEDLYRRDFTINSLAYDIKNNYIIDYFGGLEDFNNKILRKIHENSYIEDATRIFRGIRYMTRYNFEFKDEEEVKKLIEEDILKTISNDRLLKEILIILEEKKFTQIIEKLAYYKIFNININMLKEEPDSSKPKDIDEKIIDLVYSINDLDGDLFIKNSILDKKITKAIKIFIRRNVLDKLLKYRGNNEIFNVLKGLSKYDLMFLKKDKRVFYKVLNFENNISKINIKITGKDLLEKGYKQGIEIGDILENLCKISRNTLILGDFYGCEYKNK